MAITSMEHHFDNLTGQIASAIAVAASWLAVWLGVMPVVLASLASLAALLFYCLQFYRDPSVQAWLTRRRAKKVAKLKDKLAALEAKSTPEK